MCNPVVFGPHQTSVCDPVFSPHQTNRPKRAHTSMCMEVTCKCRLLGLSLLALADFAHMKRSCCCDCYITFLPQSFWIAHSLLFELSWQLISRVQPDAMTCVSCLIGLRYVEPFSSVSLHLFSPSLLFVVFFRATHVIHPSSSRRCPLSGAIKACATL